MTHKINKEDMKKIIGFLGDMYYKSTEYKVYFKEPESRMLYDLWNNNFNIFEKSLKGNYMFQTSTLSDGAFIFRYY